MPSWRTKHLPAPLTRPSRSPRRAGPIVFTPTVSATVGTFPFALTGSRSYQLEGIPVTAKDTLLADAPPCRSPRARKSPTTERW